MTDKTIGAAVEDAGERVREALENMVDAFTSDTGEVERRLAIKDARAALAGSATPEAEPVAVRWRFREGKDQTWRHNERLRGFDASVVEVEPLYTRPTASAGDALTEDAVDQAMKGPTK